MTAKPNTPNTLSLAFSEDLYAAWRDDPRSVPDNWRAYFASPAGATQYGVAGAPANAALPRAVETD